MSEEKIVGFDTPPGHKSGVVTLVGRPNVGKSTLLNAFMQQKIAIVTPRPQTTRARQLGILTEPHFQMIFVDTPGLMKPRHRLDAFMVETAVETLEDADVILWLVDASEPVGPGDRAIARQLAELTTAAPIILAMNTTARSGNGRDHHPGAQQSDLLGADQVLPRTEAYQALCCLTRSGFYFRPFAETAVMNYSKCS
jgi:GTP-binding protein Era